MKEIVLGLTSTEDYNRYSDHLFQCLPYANEKCPGIFSVSSNKLLNIRLLPSKTSSLVFHVNDIQEAEKQLNMVNMNGGRIGYMDGSDPEATELDMLNKWWRDQLATAWKE